MATLNESGSGVAAAASSISSPTRDQHYSNYGFSDPDELTTTSNHRSNSAAPDFQTNDSLDAASFPSDVRPKHLSSSTSEPAVLNTDSSTYRTMPAHLTYKTNDGIVISEEAVVVVRTDGTRVIMTKGAAAGDETVSANMVEIMDHNGISRAADNYVETPSEVEKPVKYRDLKWLLGFSIIATILFFPTGLAAIYYSLRTKTEFYRGVQRNNLDEATRYAKKTQKYVIFSLVIALFVGLIAVSFISAFLEREHGRNSTRVRRRQFTHHLG